jgi:Spy/CpxP family protein refolding chaperone
MRKLAGLIAISFFIVLATEGASAQVALKELPAGKWWTKRPIIRELMLSPQQQARIENVWTQRAQALMGQQAELQKRQQILSDLLREDTIDVPVAMKVFDEAQQIRLNLERSTFLMRITIKSLLTPEQQKKIEEIAERTRTRKGQTSEAAGAGRIITPVKKQER